MGKPGVYLKDRRTGELYGWNYEMAKLPYMEEGDAKDKKWNNGKPDPDYVEEDSGFPISDEPAYGEPEAEPAVPVEAQVAAAAGEAELDSDEVVVNPAPVLTAGEPPWAVDMSGERLLTEDGDQLVYVLDDKGVPTVGADGTPNLEIYTEPEKKSSRKK